MREKTKPPKHPSPLVSLPPLAGRKAISPRNGPQRSEGVVIGTSEVETKKYLGHKKRGKSFKD